jgi:DNA polymerase-4
VLVALVDRVTRRMRRAGLVGRTVVLRLRFGDYARVTRSRTLGRPTAAARPFLVTLRGLLDGARGAVDERGLTLLGITVTNLEHVTGGVQLELDVEGADRIELEATLDAVRDRFGAGALTRATLVGADEELGAWMGPVDPERG